MSGPGATRTEAVADWQWWYANRDAWAQFVTQLVNDGWASPLTDPTNANARHAAVAAWQAWYALQS